MLLASVMNDGFSTAPVTGSSVSTRLAAVVDGQQHLLLGAGGRGGHGSQAGHADQGQHADQARANGGEQRHRSLRVDGPQHIGPAPGPLLESSPMSGSTLGALFRVTNFGESHGPAIGCVIDGCPPGLALAAADIQQQLDRRRPGTSRHVTQRQEADAVEIVSGVFEGHTTGTPICLLIRNTDQRSSDYGNLLDTFRPGHADYAYWRKYGHRDPRGGGRSSARLTAPTVAAGAVARKWLLERHGIRFSGWMSALGETEIPFEGEQHIARNPFFAANVSLIDQLEAQMDALRRAGDSCGARIELRASGLPPGLGEPLYDRLDADIAHALMGLNAVKGVEIGAGFGLRAAARQHARRRADARGLCQQPRRRRARRHLHRAGPGGADRRQADQFDPHAAAIDHARRHADHGGHAGPPRPVCGHPRHADCRGAAGAGGDGPCAAPPRAVRRRAAPAAADRGQPLNG